MGHGKDPHPDRIYNTSRVASEGVPGLALTLTLTQLVRLLGMFAETRKQKIMMFLSWIVKSGNVRDRFRARDSSENTTPKKRDALIPCLV